ncbi:MAG: lactonase family protein, partial [Actinomycetota bacterium]
MAKPRSIRSLLAGAFAAALVVVALPEPLSAAPGDLTFVSCIADDGMSGCTDPPLDPLFNAETLVVSPDGTSVYATANFHGALVHFTRAANGTLTFAQCFARNGNQGCTDLPGMDPFNSPETVAISPDGTSVYVASSGAADAIVHFTRAADGTLAFESCIAENGNAGCDNPPTDSLDGANAVTVSLDGTSVYAASFTDNSITHLIRAPDGSLTFGGCVANFGQSGCVNPPQDPLSLASQVAVSPDGTSVYVTSFGDHSITHFTRAATGALSFVRCIADGGLSGCEDPPLDSLNSARQVAVSPEGSSVYVAGNGDNAVTSFVRAPDGSLTFQGCISDAGQAGCVDPPIDALGNAFTVAISPSGTSLYVGALTDNAVNHFARAPDGDLTFTGCVSEAGDQGCSDPPIDSLFGAHGVAVSPGGASVYVAAGSDGAITHFARELPPCQGKPGTVE